jgi:hypothetical protein
MQELGQLLAQTLVALALVTDDDRTLEQHVLELLRQGAPKTSGGSAKDEKVTIGRFLPGNMIRWSIHEKSDRLVRRGVFGIRPGVGERR